MDDSFVDFVNSLGGDAQNSITSFIGRLNSLNQII